MNIFSRTAHVLLVYVAFIGLYGEDVFSRQITYTPEESSRLWIEGRSNVNEFECRAQEYRGEATLFQEAVPAEIVKNEAENVFLQVVIDVESFECGRSRMNRDLQEALKAETHPEITFSFTGAEPVNSTGDKAGVNEGESTFEIEVRGDLTVAGETRELRFITKAAYITESRVRATGSTAIRMSDFNVEPPTALMGLVKADEELTVHFDLIATERPGVCELCPEEWRQ